MIRNKSFTNNSNPLYLVATPIGNLKEFTIRAKEICEQADLIAAEDTRNSGALLMNFGIKKPLFSLREHNEKQASETIVKEILSGKKVVYMSDAGYPLISDPGLILVRECIQNNIPVSCVSGSSAFLAALVGSGIDSSHFYFYGFLPAKTSQAEKELETLRNKTETLIFYESPHRIEETLSTLFKVLGNRKVTIARELTKINEEYIYSTLEEVQQIDIPSLKGEMVIVVEGNLQENNSNDINIEEQLTFLLSKNISKKDAVDILVHLFKLNKNDIYKYIK